MLKKKKKQTKNIEVPSSYIEMQVHNISRRRRKNP